MGLEDGRRDAKRDGEGRTIYTLKAKGFGLATEQDFYALGFRAGYFEGRE
jgi:hypothetical protein